VPYPGFPPVPAIPCLFSAADAAHVRTYVDGYNKAIADIVAGSTNATLVDIHSLFDDISAKGYDTGDRNLNTGYFGGLFSLDGIHPTNTAYAIIAQKFIDTMNANLHTSIPAVDINKIAKSDPLVY
jgi:lysophospholipase L1-like esterase